MVIRPRYKNVLKLIGNTPVAQLHFDSPATVLAKLEYLNPGGSIKSRPALFMIEEAEKTGQLKPGGTIIEASSGNQGIALAMIGAAKGYKVIITVPDKTSKEKIATLKAYGAKVFACPDTKDKNDPNGYHAKAQYFLATIPNAFMPNQYHNKQNPLAHYKTTGPEIWKQTSGTVTHFIAGKGSCGTISGIGKYLKEQNPNIRIIAVDEAPTTKKNKHKIEGIGVGINTNLDTSVVDEFVFIDGSDAFAMAKKMAKEGFLIGLSSGAVMHATQQYAKKLTQDDVVVTILADSGRAYLTKLFL